MKWRQRCKWLVSLITVLVGFSEGLLDCVFPPYEPGHPAGLEMNYFVTLLSLPSHLQASVLGINSFSHKKSKLPTAWKWLVKPGAWHDGPSPVVRPSCGIHGSTVTGTRASSGLTAQGESWGSRTSGRIWKAFWILLWQTALYSGHIQGKSAGGKMLGMEGGSSSSYFLRANLLSVLKTQMMMVAMTVITAWWGPIMCPYLLRSSREFCILLCIMRPFCPRLWEE